MKTHKQNCKAKTHFPTEKYTVIDVETSGFNSETHEMIRLEALKISGMRSVAAVLRLN